MYHLESLLQPHQVTSRPPEKAEKRILDLIGYVEEHDAIFERYRDVSSRYIKCADLSKSDEVNKISRQLITLLRQSHFSLEALLEQHPGLEDAITEHAPPNGNEHERTENSSNGLIGERMF